MDSHSRGVGIRNIGLVQQEQDWDEGYRTSQGLMNKDIIEIRGIGLMNKGHNWYKGYRINE